MSAGFTAKPCEVCGMPIGPGRLSTCSTECRRVFERRAQEERRRDAWRRSVHAMLDLLLAKQWGRS